MRLASCREWHCVRFFSSHHAAADVARRKEPETAIIFRRFVMRKFIKNLFKAVVGTKKTPTVTKQPTNQQRLGVESLDSRELMSVNPIATSTMDNQALDPNEMKYLQEGGREALLEHAV